MQYYKNGLDIGICNTMFAQRKFVTWIFKLVTSIGVQNIPMWVIKGFKD